MAKIGRPLGLVRYDTENSLLGKSSKVLRPRVIVYALILIFYAAVFYMLLLKRNLSEFHVLRGSTKSQFSVISEGIISNHFQVRVTNKSEVVRKYQFKVLNEEQIETIVPVNPFILEAAKVGTTPLFINFPESLLVGGKKAVTIEMLDDHGYRGTQRLTLLGPGK